MSIRKYKCEECDHLFSFSHSLKQHKQAQHEFIVYSCEQCDYKISYKSKLNLHIKTIHEGQRFPCEYCDWKGLASVGLRVHIKGKHGEDTVSKYDLKRKIKRQEKIELDKTCPICFKEFKVNQLKKHLDRHHERKIHKCDECEKSFVTSYELKAHKLVHIGYRPFKCTENKCT